MLSLRRILKMVSNGVKVVKAEGEKAADRSAEVQKIIKEVGVDTLAKNYITIVNEMIVQSRREKKDKLEGKDTSAPKKEAKSKN